MNCPIMMLECQFVTHFPNGFRATWRFSSDVLSEKVHSTDHGAFPQWAAWHRAQAAQLQTHCGDLMQRFGYGQEPEWLAKVHGK